MADPIHTTLMGLDAGLFKKQRIVVMKLVMAGLAQKARNPDKDPKKFRARVSLSAEELELLDGLSAFLDEVTDYLADNLGLTEFLLTESAEGGKDVL